MAKPPTKLIDRLRDDYKSRRREVDILGDTVFVTPLTTAEQIRISAMHPDDGALRMAEMLISKCTDAAGKPVFDKDDKQDLKRAVAGDRLAAAIAAITGPPVEAIAKN